MSDKPLSRFREEVSIVLCGEAGQGIQTVEHILTQTLKLSGYHVFSTEEYMSRIRGGSNSTLVRVSSNRVSAPVDRIDLLIPFSSGAIGHVQDRISPMTILLGEKKIYGKEYQGERAIDVPLSQIASEVGGPIYSNTVAVALLAGLLKVEREVFDRYLRQHFTGKDEAIIQKNFEAARRGYGVSDELLRNGTLQIDLVKHNETKDEILIDGVEALAMGVVAGGCNFLSFYPMSPSTAVAVLLAQHSKEFGIIVEQAEDEISAMNMVIGAWYAGARGLASTSGGGFALMVEGLSLAGMIESPLVIHLGQRPGPATGLPTRTEQGELLFALHAGHGEFPRIILAPGTIEDCFYLAQKAFNLADQYQVPVFILTDQYLLESHYNIPSLDPTRTPLEKHVVETKQGYKRYQLMEGGLSPRGIPGFGEGLVVLDSDEHDEEGHITEDLGLRTKMVDKRSKKLDLLRRDTIPPELIGPQNYETLIIGWGSTYHAIREALENLATKGVAFLHFKQVYPLHPDSIAYFKKAKRTVIVENNGSGQFSQLIRLQTGFNMDREILKYNGLPFSAGELEEKVKSVLD
ncbi:MAG TPA: 2-oxoacid:acceptor oxidoreductase subunit alpha [Thermodesulfobacteriota bacterium]|nr:2-oxoacid:acceptor oxidoreductase subunit alpha [Thermodesulfobacteriota bacterium]